MIVKKSENTVNRFNSDFYISTGSSDIKTLAKLPVFKELGKRSVLKVF